MKPSLSCFIFTARSDAYFIEHTLPPLLAMCSKTEGNISVIVDSSRPSGVLSLSIAQSEIKDLLALLNEMQKQFPFKVVINKEDKTKSKPLSKLHFGRTYKESHCFRGYPIHGSIKQFHDTESEYILHLDSDMIFHEAPDFSWIQEGIRIMEDNDDILCVLPRGGPPTSYGTLHQGSTEYQVDKKRGVYLFKNFTSRHYLIHRKRFMDLLPIKPLWLSWRDPIKSFLFGKGKMLCWESMISNALENSDYWRADLMTEKAWSLHPGDRSQKFYDLLPRIIKAIECCKFPESQRGHFDLVLEDWEKFFKTSNQN